MTAHQQAFKDEGDSYRVLAHKAEKPVLPSHIVGVLEEYTDIVVSFFQALAPVLLSLQGHHNEQVLARKCKASLPAIPRLDVAD
eukprot:747845-Hanusia_phi.AAC.3